MSRVSMEKPQRNCLVFRGPMVPRMSGGALHGDGEVAVLFLDLIVGHGGGAVIGHGSGHHEDVHVRQSGW